MKKLILSKSSLLVVLVILLTTISSCGDEDVIEFPIEAQSPVQIPNNYLQILTPVVSFAAGTESYPFEFNVIVSQFESISEVRVYSTFTDAASNGGAVSNEVIFGTYAVTDDAREVIQEEISYSDLRDGILLDGNPLPESDSELSVGSGWSFRYTGVLNGEEIDLLGSTNVAVLSPFAGLYEAVNTAYYRINIESGLTDWSGERRFIGSVDENTFSYNDFWGPFSNTGEFWVFDLNEDNSITVLDDESQLVFSGTDMLTCQEDGNFFNNVPCDGSNILIPDFVTGQHTIILTYGYYTASGDENEGPREFYEVLRKIVD